MVHLEMSMCSRVTRAGTERWKTSTVPAWGYWVGALGATGEGTSQVKRQQDSPGTTVDWVWEAGGERRQVRHSAGQTQCTERAPWGQRGDAKMQAR